MRNETHWKELRREEILTLAHEARLMIADGGMSYMNDMATQKELIAFVRMIEARSLPQGKQPKN